MGRRLGQHFLRDPAILDRIVDALDPRPDDVVLEIGAGEGDLTRRLALRVGTVIAIEKDPELAARVRATCNVQRAAAEAPAVVVIEGDALELDWHDTLHAARCTLHDAKVLGNIPYYITSPLIDKALTPPMPACVVFLVQKEVADRVVSPPGGKAYGALSVGVQSVARAERLFTVRAGAFSPPPEVDSALLRLTPLAAPLVPAEDRAAYRRFVTALFGQRRKQLGRSLRAVTGMDRARVTGLLEGVGITPSARAEELPPEQFATLFRRVRAN